MNRPPGVDVALDRAAVLTPLRGVTDALTGTFGVSGLAWLDAVTGVVPPEGRLPVELPRSMEAVRRSREVHGLRLDGGPIAPADR